jgi:hypothetical protein
MDKGYWQYHIAILVNRFLAATKSFNKCNETQKAAISLARELIY